MVVLSSNSTSGFSTSIVTCFEVNDLTKCNPFIPGTCLIPIISLTEKVCALLKLIKTLLRLGFSLQF